MVRNSASESWRTVSTMRSRCRKVGVASLVSASNTASEFELPFVVQGPWEDPLIFPADPVSLIKRSPVAASLLDAVKDPKARDAVRSALEHFGGGAKSGDADATPANGPATVQNPKPN